MVKVTNPSEETFKIKDSICTKRKIGKIPPTHNVKLRSKTKRNKKKK